MEAPRGASGRMWRMRPLGGRGSDYASLVSAGGGNLSEPVARRLSADDNEELSRYSTTVGDNTEQTGGRERSLLGQEYAQLQLAIPPAMRLATPYIARGLGALLGAGAGVVLKQEGESERPSPETSPVSLPITPRPDLPPVAGGRGGQYVKGIVGPPNSAIQGGRPGRIFITDDNGKVVLDVTKDRVKPVGSGGKTFDRKRDPTPQELDLLDRMKR